MDAFFPCHSPCIASLRSLILGMGRDSETCATLRQLCWWRHHHKCDWCGHLLRSVPQVWCVLGYPRVQWQRATRRNINSWHPANCGAWGCGTWGSEARERRTSLPPVAGTVGALSSGHWTWGWAASRRHCRWSGAGLLALARSWGCWNPWSWDQPLCRWPRWLVWPGWPQCLSWWQRCLGRWSHRRPWSLDDPWPKGSHQRSEDLGPNCMAMKLATPWSTATIQPRRAHLFILAKPPATDQVCGKPRLMWPNRSLPSTSHPHRRTCKGLDQSIWRPKACRQPMTLGFPEVSPACMLAPYSCSPGMHTCLILIHIQYASQLWTCARTPLARLILNFSVDYEPSLKHLAVGSLDSWRLRCSQTSTKKKMSGVDWGLLSLWSWGCFEAKLNTTIWAQELIVLLNFQRPSGRTNVQRISKDDQGLV